MDEHAVVGEWVDVALLSDQRRGGQATPRLRAVGSKAARLVLAPLE